MAADNFQDELFVLIEADAGSSRNFVVVVVAAADAVRDFDGFRAPGFMMTGLTMTGSALTRSVMTGSATMNSRLRGLI